MTDEPNTSPRGERQPLPDCPDLALFLGQLFHRLGCRLSIDNGSRWTWRPEPICSPQLPEAEPHEQFANVDEWRGAVKVAAYCISRLSSADKELVFGIFAAENGVRGDFDFRDLMQ